MSLRNNVWLVLIPLLLTGCGFQPLYGKKTSDKDISKVFAGVKVDDIPAKNGQMLRIKLEDKLNPDGIAAKPEYRLHVIFRSSVTPIGVARDGTVSRYNVYLTSKFVLYRTSDDKPVTSGDIGYVDSYNNLTNAYFSTYISSEDALKNGVNEMSELYRERLSSYFNEGAPVQDVKIPTEEEEKAAPNNVPTNPLLYSPPLSTTTPHP